MIIGVGCIARKKDEIHNFFKGIGDTVIRSKEWIAWWDDSQKVLWFDIHVCYPVLVTKDTPHPALLPPPHRLNTVFALGKWCEDPHKDCDTKTQKMFLFFQKIIFMFQNLRCQKVKKKNIIIINLHTYMSSEGITWMNHQF